VKCFTHPQADAVAQCSQCHKGICITCAHNAGGATFCSSCFETGLRKEIAHAHRSTVGIAMLVGAFTGIQKYNEARRIVANGNQLIAELYTLPIQQMPGTQSGGTA
jgi:ribosomal protein L40E